MDRAGQRRRSLTRALLLGLGTAGAWFVLSLLSPAPASADDGDEGGGGLLGVAQGVVHGVTGTADHVVGGVAEHVPVLEPAAPVVSSTAEVVDTVVDTATGAVATVVDTAPVGSVVAPVLDAVDAVTGGIPIVAEVVDRSGIMPVVTDTVAAVDTTVTEVVVGDAPDAAAPPVTVPAPVAPAPSSGGHAPASDPTPAQVDVAATATGADIDPITSAAPPREGPPPPRPGWMLGTSPDAVITAASAPASTPHSPVPPAAPAEGAVSGVFASSTGAWGPHAVAVLGCTPQLRLQGRSLPTPGDDDLPGAPVLSTDHAPD